MRLFCLLYPTRHSRRNAPWTSFEVLEARITEESWSEPGLEFGFSLVGGEGVEFYEEILDEKVPFPDLLE